MEDYDLHLTIGPNGPGLTHSRTITDDEAKDALDLQTRIDAIARDYDCLVAQSCPVADLRTLAELLNFPQVDQSKLENQSHPQHDTWIVIFGADRTIESANFEIKRAKALGYNAELVLLDGWFRSVATFDTEEEAFQSLTPIQAEMNRPDAYVRLLNRWCENSTQVDFETPYTKCDAT